MKRFDIIAVFLTIMVIPFIDMLPPLGLGAFGLATIGYVAARGLS